MDFSTIPALAGDDTFHVVVEAPRGSTLKLKYDETLRAMSISRPLPLGLTYPFDFGFVPATLAEDGDPLDAMLIWDVPSYPGVVVACRAIGVLQVEQNLTNHDRSTRIRNDRLLAVPVEARRERTYESLDALPARVREELAQFAVAATALEGKDARVVGWSDADAAFALVGDCVRRLRRKSGTSRRARRRVSATARRRPTTR